MTGEVPVRTEEEQSAKGRNLGVQAAFATADLYTPEQGLRWGQEGLTKRELFAAMAMQGLAPAYAQGGDFMEQHVAEGAVKVADALLKELAK